VLQLLEQVQESLRQQLARQQLARQQLARQQLALVLQLVLHRLCQ
jgi:hypothetical protein